MMDNETKEGKDGRKKEINIIKEILLGGGNTTKRERNLGTKRGKYGKMKGKEVKIVKREG